MSKQQRTRAELMAEVKVLRDALLAAEAAMTNSPAFNKHDLGPTASLKAVRRALGFAVKEEEK